MFCSDVDDEYENKIFEEKDIDVTKKLEKNNTQFQGTCFMLIQSDSNKTAAFKPQIVLGSVAEKHLPSVGITPAQSISKMPNSSKNANASGVDPPQYPPAKARPKALSAFAAFV